MGKIGKIELVHVDVKSCQITVEQIKIENKIQKIEKKNWENGIGTS